jgi:T5orf172 domain
MSLDDVFRDRYYDEGYIYIAGSRSGVAIKVGVTANMGRYLKRLRHIKYGGCDDWIILYHVWVKENAGKIEHDVRRLLRRHKVLKKYVKDGAQQTAREILECSFSLVRDTLYDLIDEDAKGTAWQSKYTERYEFPSRRWRLLRARILEE